MGIRDAPGAGAERCASQYAPTPQGVDKVSRGMRVLRKLFVLVGVLVAAGVAASAALGAGHGRRAHPRSSQLVTITRDSAGIPHIVARNFSALGYGEGYVFAQDNLCTFADDIVTLEGQRSK